MKTTNTKVALGRELRSAREKRGLTPAQLGLQARVRSGFIETIEGGGAYMYLNSGVQRGLWRYIIARLAFVLGEDQATWLTLVGLKPLSIDEMGKIEAKLTGHFEPPQATLMVSAEDLEFLLETAKQLKQPIPITTVLQLLRMRNT